MNPTKPGPVRALEPALEAHMRFRQSLNLESAARIELFARQQRSALTESEATVSATPCVEALTVGSP